MRFDTTPMPRTPMAGDGSTQRGARSLTVEDLLADLLLRDARVLAGGRGTDRPVVDMQWWDGNELPESTDQVLVHESAEGLPPYLLEAGLRRASDGAASAILLVGAHGHLISSTIRLADRLMIPLIAVESDEPRSFAHALAVLLRSPQLTRAAQVEALVRRLRSRRRTPDVVLGALRDVAGLEATVLAGDGSLLLGAAQPLPGSARLDLSVPQQLPVAGGTLLLQPVYGPAARGTVAWLALRLESSRPYVIENAADLLSILEPSMAAWLSEERLAAEQNARSRSQLLTELLERGESVGKETVHQAVAAGWRLYGWHTGVHIGLRGGDDDRDFVLMQFERVRRVLTAAGIEGTLVERPDGWSVWVTSFNQPSMVQQREFGERVRKALEAMPAQWEIFAGIGRPHVGIVGIASTLSDARDAATLARTDRSVRRVKHVEDLGVSRILLSWQGSDDLRAYAGSVLAPLRRVQSGQLLETLRSYLDNRSSIGLTADAMNLHRNTVTTRLRRIRDLLGVDLDDPDERLALSMACRIVETDETH
ncbi:helix-turn-helix domain-containing protein [Amycolatopsis sp. NBC_01307]|uniref:PucR family transcriptional regulator n=1 Tax=Amycolatopsis sp. NBC_01307 TaxID=2903561 RepID=UPI002E11E743|nr:helix-turn-helix domain-containing protein [Amycolatopsis sp. NBC_01307]